ncbi:MAG TPA: hypothetical protein DIW31_03410 [Bacteroidales bacterium]|nr:hypothetical protein [Bacteroidales bacterium]
MKKIFLILLPLFLLSCSHTPKGILRVKVQSKIYKVVDDVFLLKKLNSETSNERFEVDKAIKLDTGKYILQIPFYAKSGMFYNDGTIEDTILVKFDKEINAYLVGGDFSGMFASDPKLEIDE